MTRFYARAEVVSILRISPSTSVTPGLFSWIRADKEANLRRLERMVREAPKGGARIVVTTECFLDGYAIEHKSIPGRVATYAR